MNFPKLSDNPGLRVQKGVTSGADRISITQQTNLNHLDRSLREHWQLGQNILLCWCRVENGIQVLKAPHYFLGRFTATLSDCSSVDRLEALNGRFIRELITNSRVLSKREFAGAASRLELEPVTITLPLTLQHKRVINDTVDAMIKRYSINYVQSRAVLLFDIVGFSLVSPFEQTSQLNSLSHSLNSAHNKLRKQNININFSRTTTGDGYYVWHQNESPKANMELFQFMLLVLADNALARRAARSNSSAGLIAPSIRTGFHIGSHFEFYQVEGLNPGMNSYIVGDVTIELARMVDLARPGQIFIGEFETRAPTSQREEAYLVPATSQQFVDRASRQSQALLGVTLSGEHIDEIHCFLTGNTGASGGQSVRHYPITDKHGRTRNACNLRINIRVRESNRPLILGIQDGPMPRRSVRKSAFNLSARMSEKSSKVIKKRTEIDFSAIEE